MALLFDRLYVVQAVRIVAMPEHLRVRGVTMVVVRV
jgi:hypothetical protein